MVEENIAGWGNGVPPVLLAGNCWFESGACNHANSKTTVSPPAVVFFDKYYRKAGDGISKTGRPLKEIDQAEFEKLCFMQCTMEEICSFFDITDKTLTKWCKRTYGTSFSETYKNKSVGGKISLRRAQFKLAEKSATMAIFLGKQYLGQTDKIEGAFDLSGINELNESMLDNIAPNRDIEDFE